MTSVYRQFLNLILTNSMICDISMIFLNDHPECSSVRVRMIDGVVVITGTLNYQGEIEHMRNAYEGRL